MMEVVWIPLFVGICNYLFFVLRTITNNYPLVVK